MISQTIARAGDYFKTIKAANKSIGDAGAYCDEGIVAKFRSYLEVDKKSMERSQKRKKEGIKFEGLITDVLKTKFEEINWEDKDSRISAEHELEGEGIDMLGYNDLSNEKGLWVAIQVKDKELSLREDDTKKFLDTVEELRVKYPNDVFLLYLVLAKKKSYTAELAMDMCEKGAKVVWDTNGERLTNILGRDLEVIQAIVL